MSLEQRCETCDRPKLMYAKTTIVICPYCDPICEKCNSSKKDHVSGEYKTSQSNVKCSLEWKWDTESWKMT